MPGDYAEAPADALALFCGRYLEILPYEGSVRMGRVSLAETARFPAGAALFYDVVFTAVHARLSDYLRATVDLTAPSAADAARRLSGQVLYPRFPRALFGVDPLAPSFADDALSPDFDLPPIRTAVADVLASLRTR